MITDPRAMLAPPPPMLALPARVPSRLPLDTVTCSDALAFLRGLPDASVDVVITDPPYGVGKSFWDVRFPVDWIDEAWRVTSRMLVMPGNTALIEAGRVVGRYRDCIVMHSRNGMTLSKIAFGNWFPVLACGDWKWQARSNHISFDVVVTEKIDHPSPKPLSAMLKLIEKYTEPGWVILDPFCGSGTTLLAARNTGRHYIGCDISAEYVAIARERLRMPFEQHHVIKETKLDDLPLFAQGANS